MIKIDETDRQIVRLMGKNARLTSEEMAKELGTSAATVRRRINRLIKKDALRIIGVIDPRIFGLPIAAFLALDVSHKNIDTVMDELASMPETRWISTTTGRFNIVVYARFHSNDNLSNFMIEKLGDLEGLKYSEIFMCLDMRKASYIPYAESGPLHKYERNNNTETSI